MGGIVGLVGFDGSVERARAVVTGMKRPLAHDLDDGRVEAHPDATLAMHRLATVDLEHGGRPFSNEDGSVVIVHHGYISNAPRLRAELQERGVALRTRSDTEVLLRLYEQDPHGLERHLVGAWAFAVHDRRRRRVVLSRDRFGSRPLFIADTGRALAFASDLRCFDRSLEGFSRLFDVDHDAAHAMVAWSYVPEAATIFKGVRRLPPATRLSISLETGARDERTYWHLEPSSEAARVRSLEAACEGTEPLLRRAVTEHLESDVPVATFLSGGIDSSLVTAYAHAAAPGAIKAYSIGFQESSFDESSYARETATHIGVDLIAEIFDEGTALAKLADALLAYDEPFGDSSSLATHLACSQISRDAGVALGGDGADEIFAGYKKYLVAHLRRPFAAAPAVRDALGWMLGRLPSVNDRTRRWTELSRTARRVSRALLGSDAHIYAQLTQVAPLADAAPLMRLSANPERFERALRARFERGSGSELQRSLITDLGGMLPNDMLVKVERASRACHLETRSPFLDHRVAEYGVGLPARFTLGAPTRRWAGKTVLRSLHERRFGPTLANRKKQGFGVPVESWLRGPFAPACERLFARARLERYGVLSSAELSGGALQKWLVTHPILVWHAFALAAWCEASLGDGPQALQELLTVA